MNFVIFLSGDHPDMGAFEALQQFQVHGDELDVATTDIRLDVQNRLLLIRANSRHAGNQDKLKEILQRIVPKLALCHDAGLLLFDIPLKDTSKCRNEEKRNVSSRIFRTIVDAAREQLTRLNWREIGKKGSTFAVRIQKIGEESTQFFDRSLTSRLARELGGLIHECFAGKKKVDLDDPEIAFHGILSPSRFYLYQVVSRSARKALGLRNPKKRPYSNPSILDPFLLRAMINIAQVKPGDVILDPFCGTGSTFIEAADLRVLAIGIELSRLVSWGALQNIQGLSLPAHLVLSDARLMPLGTDSVDAIIFDPPYGRGASTLGSNISDLLRETLIQGERVLKRGGFLVMALIHAVKLDDFYPSSSNLRLIKTFEWYVHRSMTRKIYIFENDK